MTNERHLKIQGTRLRSALNSIKRTPEAAARELSIPLDRLTNILNGQASQGEVDIFLGELGKTYPLEPSSLTTPVDDTTSGIRIMRASESLEKSRIFDRKNSSGERTPYYEYRDSAMSRMSPIKPEWIKELRAVSDSDPNNPDVAYNNGHFQHQMTFFIGPVNFYWDVNGVKYSAELNTGDSNYITPFHPHSFTTRNPHENAIIMAVTFDGEVSRAQNEFSVLGKHAIKKATLPFRDYDKAVGRLVEQHMKNSRLSVSNLEKKLKENGFTGNLFEVIQGSQVLPERDKKMIADVLSIEKTDLDIPLYKPEEEVVVKHKQELESYFYPDDNHPLYRINDLANTSKMPLMRGSDIEVLTGIAEFNSAFESSLHTFLFNYGKTPINMIWEYDDKPHTDFISPGDSIYLKPFVKHAFSNSDNNINGKLVALSTSGAINLQTQRELSYFPEGGRVANESKVWFD